MHPTTFEVVDPPTPKSKPQGLFAVLLGDEPAVLLQDATENPGKYDEQTVGLLEELVQGSKKVKELGEAERRLLDLATLTFSSYVPPPKPPRKEERQPQAEKFAEEIEYGLSEEDMTVPEGTTDYWWL